MSRPSLGLRATGGRARVGSRGVRRENWVPLIGTVCHRRIVLFYGSSRAQAAGRCPALSKLQTAEAATELQPSSKASTSENPEDGAECSSELGTVASPTDSTLPSPSGKLPGTLALVAVSLLWSTHSPTIKFIFSQPFAMLASGRAGEGGKQDVHPDPTALNAMRMLVAAAILLVPTAAAQLLGRGREVAGDGKKEGEERMASGSEASSSVAGTAGWEERRSGGVVRWLLNRRPEVLAVAAAELGLINFLGTQSQVMGLQMTTSLHASFLMQATSAITPTMSALAGFPVPARDWAACGMALTGTLLIQVDSVLDKAGGQLSGPGSAALQQQLGGDALILAAATIYSLSTLRLQVVSTRFKPGPLAAGKTGAMAAIACTCFLLQAAWDTQHAAAAVAGAAASTEPGLAALSHSLAATAAQTSQMAPETMLAIVWSAAGPGGLAMFLQAWGQRFLPATSAQVIFSSIPFFSMMFSFWWLHEPLFGKTGWLGACFVVSAGLLALAVPSPSTISRK